MNDGIDQLRVRSRTEWQALRLEFEAAFPDISGEGWRTLEPEVEALTDRLIEANHGRVIDGPSAAIVPRICVVLASYRALTAQLGDRAAVLDGLRTALTARTKRSIVPHLTERFGIDPDRRAASFERVAENFKPPGERRFGAAFIYEQEVQDGDRSFVNIRRCLFNDLLRANGASEVTPLFCALDYVWAEEMERGEYGVRFARPTTLAAGDEMCRFQFFRAADSVDPTRGG